jgi:hypothetical protein
VRALVILVLTVRAASQSVQLRGLAQVGFDPGQIHRALQRRV